MQAPKREQVTLSMVANVIEDYFKAPEPPGKELELKLMEQMKNNAKLFEATHKKFPDKDKAQDLMKIDLDKFVDPEPKERLESDGQIALKVRMINGKQYVIHETHVYDTLIKISLRYNVPVEQLRAIN